MRPSRPLLAALVGVQLAYPQLPAERRTAATHGIVGLLLATTASDAVEVDGAGRALGTVGLAGALGYATELLAVRTGRPFGRYRYTAKLGPGVGGVPFAVAASWAMMSRPAWTVAGLLTERRGARVLFAAGALTAWDVYVDPRMVRDGYWEWPQGGRYEGVPAENFLGWFLTATGVFAAWALVSGPDDPREGGADVSLAVYTWTWVGEAVANVLFWKRPRVAIAGGLAMGAFAAPALRARLRPRVRPGGAR
ncbi:MAG: carotenoid biosynthesis protein [Solirubrobacterales bacterium]|nr:carotenoid biosynthesis protein [Solirubrobacterales bacterium]